MNQLIFYKVKKQKTKKTKKQKKKKTKQKKGKSLAPNQLELSSFNTLYND